MAKHELLANGKPEIEFQWKNQEKSKLFAPDNDSITVASKRIFIYATVYGRFPICNTKFRTTSVGSLVSFHFSFLFEQTQNIFIEYQIDLFASVDARKIDFLVFRSKWPRSSSFRMGIGWFKMVPIGRLSNFYSEIEWNRRRSRLYANCF